MRIAGFASEKLRDAALAGSDALRAASDAMYSPRSHDAMQLALDSWDKAAASLQERQARAKRDNDERHGPQQRKVEVLQELLRELKKTEDPNSEVIRNAELELEEAQKELHLPYHAGWLFRVTHGGVMLGLQDFAVERCCASLQLSMLPGRLASGAQQAALLRIVLDASGGGEKGDRHLGHSISLRLERLRLHKLSAGFSLLPMSFEVASLTIALRCVLHLTFAYGSDQCWVCSTSKLEVHSLRTEKGGGGHLLTDMLMRWLLEKLLPGVLQVHWPPVEGALRSSDGTPMSPNDGTPMSREGTSMSRDGTSMSSDDTPMTPR